MSAATFCAYVLAIAAVLLAIAMGFTSATDNEMVGLWLVAAAVFAGANLIKMEESKPRQVSKVVFCLQCHWERQQNCSKTILPLSHYGTTGAFLLAIVVAAPATNVGVGWCVRVKGNMLRDHDRSFYVDQDSASRRFSARGSARYDTL